MSRRFISALCIIASVIIYIYSGTQAALVLMIMSILFPIADITLSLLAAGRLRVGLELPAEVKKTEGSLCKIFIENRTPIPLSRVLFTMNIENILTNRRETFTVSFFAAPFGQRYSEFEFMTEYCGRLMFTCQKVEVWNIFGLFPASHRLSIEEKRTVVPDVFPLSVTLTGGISLQGDTEAILLNKKGRDLTEMFQIRDYIEGDRLKQIHWKLSQKLDRYIVIDPAETINRELLIFWDRGVFSHETSPETVDSLAESVASVCLALAEESIPYSVAWSTEKEGMVEMRDITCTDDLFEVFSGMLSHVSTWDGASRIPDCVQTLNGKRYPIISYFCSKVPEELPQLSELGLTRVFLCSNDDEDESTGELVCNIFTPRDYREVLRDVVI